MSDVVPIGRNGSMADALERQIVNELAAKVRSHVETHGHVPDLAVLTLHGPGGKDSRTWSAGYFSPNHSSKTEAYGAAMAAITRALVND